jgi:hypothetical protein
MLRVIYMAKKPNTLCVFLLSVVMLNVAMLSVFLLNVAMLNVAMLSVFMLNVAMLSVVTPSVVAPNIYLLTSWAHLLFLFEPVRVPASLEAFSQGYLTYGLSSETIRMNKLGCLSFLLFTLHFFVAVLLQINCNDYSCVEGVWLF